MLKPATAKRRKRQNTKLNLVPILDAVFIFIFFLLASSQFVKMYEVASDIPTVSDEPAPPPKKDEKPPLNLTLRITNGSLTVLTGFPSKAVKTFTFKPDNPDFSELHNFVYNLKTQHPKERTAYLEPSRGLDYQLVVHVMDAIRQFNFNDQPISTQDESGETKVLEDLFDDIVFGNLET